MSIRSNRGVTLIELILFIVIVSVGLAGVLSSLNLSVRSSADPLLPKQALVIAEGLMEEILLKGYSNPDDGYAPTTCDDNEPSVLSATCDRPLFDDIGDFVGFSEAPVANYLAVVTLGNENSTDIGVKARRITVTVRQPDMQTITLVGYRAQY